MRDDHVDDFFGAADAEPQPALMPDVDTNGTGPPAARTGPAARRTVSSLRDALTGTRGPSAPVAEHADRVSAPIGPLELDGDEEMAVVGPPRPPRPIRREEVHHRPPGALQRFWAWFTDELFVSAGERAERAEDARLNRLEGSSRSNLVPFVGPRGGGGKTTHARTTGGILAGANCGSVVLLDADQHYGPAADLVPEPQRSSKTIIDLLADFEDAMEPPPPPKLRPYLSRFDDGLLLLAAPAKRKDMLRLAENLELYERALWLLQGVEVILMDTAGGIGELQQWALERADQAVVLCPPDYVAANNIAKVLSDEDLEWPERRTLVLNDSRPEGGGDLAAIERHFARHSFEARIRVPYDHEHLRLALDKATYALAALPRKTRLPLKRLAATIGEGLR